MDKRTLMLAEGAIRKIAMHHGVSTEHVRGQMKLAMLNGLCSTDPKTKEFWNSIPRKNEFPTPEEMIAYISEKTRT